MIRVESYSETLDCIDPAICITPPPNAHISFEVVSNTGIPINKTEGFIGSQVPAGVGIQFPGFNTPSDAAVLAAVIGFIKLVHNTKPETLKNGTQSVQRPTFGPVANTVEGVAVNTPGAIPKGHLNITPVIAVAAI